MPVVSQSCYELLGVPADAHGPLLDWSRAQRRREAEQRLGELGKPEVEALVARIDEAFQILSDPAASRRYRQYRSQIDAGRRVAHPEDLSTLSPDEEEAGQEEDTVTTLDEWDVDGVFDEEDDIEAQKTQAAAPAFPGGLGLLAEVVLAAPIPGEGRQPRRFDTRIAPPWLDLDPPDPAAMTPSSPSTQSIPGSSIPAAPGPDPSGRPLEPEHVPPWEDRTR